MRAIGARAGRLAGRAAIALGILVFAAVAIGPHSGRYRTLTVLTGSMRPTLPLGSVAVVVPTPVQQIAVGDVITYAIPVEDHRVVTHRVVEVIEPGVIRTKGDANTAADPWVAELKGSTAWKLRGSVPGAGYAIQALREPGLRIASVLVSTLVMVAIGMRRIWRQPALA